MNDLINKAKELREFNQWTDYLDIGKDVPCYGFRKYHPGDIVYSHSCNKRQKGEYVYVGSFRSSGRYGMYLLLNNKGNLCKHDNICFPNEWDEVNGCLAEPRFSGI